MKGIAPDSRSSTSDRARLISPHGALAGGGEMGERVRALDWSATPLGPIESWPQSLRSAVSIMLNSRYPIAIYWGPELALLYNDAWSPIPGSKHPWALGREARAVWPEIWSDIAPLFAQVMTEGNGTWSEDQLLPMHRHGFTEECYFNFTFSPIRSEDGSVGGVFNAVVETTERVLGERRTRLLRSFAERTSGAKSVEDVGSLAAEALADATADVPFTLFYVVDENTHAVRMGHTGVDDSAAILESPVSLDSTASTRWPLAAACRTLQPVLVEDLASRFGTAPASHWSEPTSRALVLPVVRSGQDMPLGFLVAGISPRLALDDEYRGFLGMLAAQLATAISNARAFEEERMRTRALAELDRAKNTFFSNVSHELRTPLTLMLGPTEELLRNASGTLTSAQAEQLAMLHRNELRLLRLVNTLLEFSRLEAGRVEASFEATDLSVLTTELASTFRSAFDRAELQLDVIAPRFPDGTPQAYVDREMWQRIVVNLLSNAFKHTFSGGVTVNLQPTADGRRVQLRVTDTGVGIPSEQLPRLFDRFHRVPNARSRTHEGTGIGLALVQELVRLHHGTLMVTSEVDVGSEFTVELPLGAAHLPADRIHGGKSRDAIRSDGIGAEAIRWTETADVHDEWSPRTAHDHEVTDKAHIMLVDDNADMREYIARLLRTRGWTVTTAGDGRSALNTVRANHGESPFDLVLSDIMMPVLDGVGLVREIRADERTRTLPVILLSARAGEESRLEGLDVGADDFLVKPFSARELIARVGTHIKLGRLRRDAMAQLESVASAREGLLDAERRARVEAERARARTEQLRRLSTELAGASSPIEVANVTIASCLASSSASRAVMLRLVEDGKYLAMLGASGYSNEDVAQFEFFPANSVLPVSEAVSTRKPVILEDTHSTEVLERFPFMREWSERTGLRSSLVFPLLSGSAGDERVLGTLAIEFDEPQSPSEADLAYYDAIARVAAQAMDRAFAYETERGLRFEADAARLRAEEANRIKGDFLAAMSHELRTPLNAIAGHTQLIELGVHGAVTEAQLDALSRIQRGQEHLLALINDVLNYAKLEAGRVEFKEERIRVFEAVKEVLSMLEPQIHSKGILATSAVPPDLEIVADGEKVAQVLLNLLSNALKFTEAGGSITIDARRIGANVHIDVVDTGCGIPSDKFDAIFEPFVQVHRSLSRNTEGTGLGLSISRDLARGMGGNLTVTSTVGSGSTFTLSLPHAGNVS